MNIKEVLGLGERLWLSGDALGDWVDAERARTRGERAGAQREQANAQNEFECLADERLRLTEEHEQRRRKQELEAGRVKATIEKNPLLRLRLVAT